MYRQYENPHTLEKELKKAKKEYQKAVEENADEETLRELHTNIEELKERVNFAWQDEEEVLE